MKTNLHNHKDLKFQGKFRPAVLFILIIVASATMDFSQQIGSSLKD